MFSFFRSTEFCEVVSVLFSRSDHCLLRLRDNQSFPPETKHSVQMCELCVVISGLITSEKDIVMSKTAVKN